VATGAAGEAVLVAVHTGAETVAEAVAVAAELAPQQMVCLRPIPESEREALAAMLEDYLTELATLVDGDWDPAHYPFLDVQWSELGHHPFFICSGTERVGLALVRDPHSTGTGLTQVSEFYVAPEYRSTGLADRAAIALFRRFPGQWELTVHVINARADRFWLRCIRAAGVGSPKVRTLEEEGGTVRQYLFDVAGADQTDSCT
jgi:predicted acetyltransferase